jgi:hypothetical protein
MGHFGKLASDMEVLMKKRCIIELFHTEKITLVEIRGRLLDVHWM